MSLPPIDSLYLQEILIELLRIPSPTGYTAMAMKRVQKALNDMGLPALSTRKGALMVDFAGAREGAIRAMTAHVDTLGAMVKEIKPNGRLKLTKIGGFAWNTVEGEGCQVFTQQGEAISGAILSIKASSHVFGQEVNKVLREDATMEVRLDARTTSVQETRALGIEIGDFVAFDPRVVVTPSGFIRSRHLDDKAGVAAMLTAIKALRDAGLKPRYRTLFHFSNYEEVGHGAASDFPADLTELVTIDMAAVGEGQASDEFSVTICVKDSGGPYHAALTTRLRQLAAAYEIPYKIDIYPYYGSDGEAYWRAGGGAPIALLGPGVDASHNYERTHFDSLLATTKLILAYLLEE